MHRRWKFVERPIARVKDADSFHGCEPQFSVRRSGDLWGVSLRKPAAPYSIEDVENCGVDLLLRFSVLVHRGHPSVQLGARNLYQAAWRVQPERIVVV